MKRRNLLVQTGLVATLLFAGSVHAAVMSTTADGIAVGAAGSKIGVGTTGDGESLTNAIKYYIPLSDPTNGTYGTGTNCNASGSAAGTCSDSGSGSGYLTANALKMNIFFDLAGLPDSKSASLSFLFDDLDLTDKNDPPGFFESISLSYWNWDGVQFDSLVALSTTLTAATPPPSDLPQNTAADNLVTWNLDLLALDALNDSAQDQNGFWIQLGFGSRFYETKTDGSIKTDSLGNPIPKFGTNTPEYLAAELTVSPVPLPAAFWLFGTALIGFVGISRRTKIS